MLTTEASAVMLIVATTMPNSAVMIGDAAARNEPKVMISAISSSPSGMAPALDRG